MFSVRKVEGSGKAPGPGSSTALWGLWTLLRSRRYLLLAQSNGSFSSLSGWGLLRERQQLESRRSDLFRFGPLVPNMGSDSEQEPTKGVLN